MDAATYNNVRSLDKLTLPPQSDYVATQGQEDEPQEARDDQSLVSEVNNPVKEDGREDEMGRQQEGERDELEDKKMTRIVDLHKQFTMLNLQPTSSFSSFSHDSAFMENRNGGKESAYDTTSMGTSSTSKMVSSSSTRDAKGIKTIKRTASSGSKSVASKNSGDIFDRLFHTSNEATRNREKVVREKLHKMKLKKQQMSRVQVSKKIPLSKAACFYDRNVEWLFQREKLVREKVEHKKLQKEQQSDDSKKVSISEAEYFYERNIEWLVNREKVVREKVENIKVQKEQVNLVDDSKKVPLSEAGCFYDRNIEWLFRREMRLMDEARKNDTKF